MFEGSLTALSLEKIAGHPNSRRFLVCARQWLLHVLVSSVVFLEVVVLACTLQRDTGTEAEKFYHLVGMTHRLLKMAKNRILFQCNIISQHLSL